MSEVGSHDEAREAEVERIYADHLARTDGEGFEELLARHPELADELRQLHEGCQSIQGTLRRFSREVASLQTNELSPGLRVGGYRLVRPLGAGGMGDVWEAAEPELGRRVALKVLHPDRLTPRGIRLFEREARAAGRVRHPGVVAVHATGRGEGLFWIAQEYVEGDRTLADFLEAESSSERPAADYYRRVAELFRDLARGLAAAHDAGVIHRDLKPSNVLLEEDGRPRVADFGLARILDEHSVSNAGDVMGTYSYMSPEQVTGRQADVDARSDVFSLGVMLYEALTRERPFEAETTEARAMRILSHEPPDPRRLEPYVPRDLAVLCKKAIEKSPRQRFQSMGELADELERFLGDSPIRSRPPGPLDRAVRGLRRHPGAAVAVGALALCVAIVALVVADSRASRERTELRATLDLALLMADYGHLDRAEEQIAAARRRAPEEPLVDLVHALCLRSTGDHERAREQLAAAADKGFDPEAEPADALARCLRGLHLLSTGGVEERLLAEADLEAAMAADRRLGAAAYTLYQTRLAIGDVEGAREALDHVAEARPGEEWSSLWEALALELDGELDAAIAALRRIDDSGEGALAEFRGHRVLGRVLLRDRRAGEAITALRQAVALAPLDTPSWLNLARALYLHSLTDGSANAEALQGEAREICLQVRADPQQEVGALLLLGQLTLEQLERNGDTLAPPPAPGWQPIEAALAEVRAVAPDDPTLRELESERLAWMADAWSRRGEAAKAAELFRASLEFDPENVRARVRLAQGMIEELGQTAQALDELEYALESWRRTQAAIRDTRPGEAFIAVPWPRLWYQSLQIWRFHAAARTGDLDTAREAREAVEGELAAGAELPFAERASYAEFLALAPGELRDCARAHELLAEQGLRAELEGSDAGRQLLRNIDDACP